MKKLMIMSLLVMAVCFIGFAQTIIPIPSGLSNSATGSYSEGIGDFDGDGSNDVSVWWDDTGSYKSFSVYSFKKDTQLLFVKDECPTLMNGQTMDYAVDLNNDAKVEIIIKNKIYSYTTVDTKKKLP